MEPVLSDRVTYHTDTKEFSGFASDMFGAANERTGITRQVRIKSKKTGVVKVFEITRTKRDNENDILFWEFRNAELGLTLTVFNT